MSNTYFSFRRFTIHQERCAMKVGTDGVLLGAWARGGSRILDVGTGTALVALMMAQRNGGAQVVGIDIDGEACLQARENVAASPYAMRVEICHARLQDYVSRHAPFDAIVCNPPFFASSLRCPDHRRSMARHEDALPVAQLMRHAARLLSPDGELSVVIPAPRKTDFDMQAALCGLYPTRVCAVKTVPRKSATRYLLAWARQSPAGVEQQEVCLNQSDGSRSPWYESLTRDFYVK
ncbi:MAG: methyltransferase [Prevotella sp.]|nr:methyltransferase [Prevotella sp.]